MTNPLPTVTRCLVERTNLHAVRFVDEPIVAPPAEGTACLRVDAFALTANNITYATFGEPSKDAIPYWDFFPSGEPGWGVVPVWGFGTVIASDRDGVDAGDRFYGYYPMASHVVVRPGRVRDGGFVDVAPAREPLPRLYNQYVRTATDALHDPATEGLQMLFRPLFITSFVLDDFLADQAFFGARSILISSASSKTAYGLAWQLSLRRPDGPAVIGLTSSRNLDHVDALGCFDRVVAYDALAAIDAAGPVVYVDFSGDRAFRARLHRHFGAALKQSIGVGASHVDALKPNDAEDLVPAGVAPRFFFAPAQIRKRSEEWGAGGFQQRFADAWRRFAARVGDRSRPWIEVVEGRGRHAVESTYRMFLDGSAPPDRGYVLSLSRR